MNYSATARLEAKGSFGTTVATAEVKRGSILYVSEALNTYDPRRIERHAKAMLGLVKRARAAHRKLYGKRAP
ncbi:MAG TPA: hypothetical protein VD838_08735 [Anaeromyxobacteraceae bacterium]|nr:hypothetical protein [Anaeromyxobacteraceae bacterium]